MTTDHDEQHDHVDDEEDDAERNIDRQEDDQDVVDDNNTIISGLTSNTGPSTVGYPCSTFSQQEESVQSPPPLQRTTAATTPAFGMKAVYSQNERAAEAGAAAAALDHPDVEAIPIEEQQSRRSPREAEEIPPLVPLARMPSTGKSVTADYPPPLNDDGSSFVTPPPPPPPQRMSRQSTPGAISVPGVDATRSDEEQHDNLLSEDDDDVEQPSPSPHSSSPPPEQRPLSYDPMTPDSPPIVAELASSAFSYDDDLEDRIAERLEAQMTARLQQEVDRRLLEERRQHAIAEVVEPTKPKSSSFRTSAAGDSDQNNNNNTTTTTLIAMHVREEENFKICGIRRTCWGMILCTFMLFIIGAVVGTILWFGREESAGSAVAAPTMAPTTVVPTSSSPSQSPTIPLEDRRWDFLLEVIGPSVAPVDEDPIEYFSDPSTPQYEALEWMATTDLETNIFETPPVILVERYALATLYFTTGGPANWTEPINFLSSDSVCDWNQDDKGVFCSDTGPLVTSVVIPENGLRGPIPWELSLLEYLIQVQFDLNFLTGSIPTHFGNLTRLASLWIQSNALTGSLPLELASATSLESIDLASNKIGSRLPSEWAPSLSNLFFVRLRMNEIVGTLPVEWRDLSNLRVLDLEENQLDGNLPKDYALLTQLSSLYLESNNFQGSLPTEYAGLTNLRNFFIYGNRLSGEMPTEYSSLSKLDNFWFHDTDIAGDVNDIFCLFPQIENMRADCQSDGPGLLPQVNCSCCTSCCTSNGTNCVNLSS